MSAIESALSPAAMGSAYWSQSSRRCWAWRRCHLRRSRTSRTVFLLRDARIVMPALAVRDRLRDAHDAAFSGASLSWTASLRRRSTCALDRSALSTEIFRGVIEIGMCTRRLLSDSHHRRGRQPCQTRAPCNHSSQWRKHAQSHCIRQAWPLNCCERPFARVSFFRCTPVSCRA